MEQARLDWSSAEVKDGVLSVGLSGERPNGWNRTFAATAALLGGGGDWDHVDLKKNRVKVSGVTPGVEDKLHHFLESVVLQANADHAPEPEDDADEDRDGHEDEPDEEDSADDSDSELTSRFKAFGD
jgi:hypothetical protein